MSTVAMNRVGLGDLPDWVEVVSEECRGGRVLHTLVDRRSRRALAVDHTELTAEGVLSEDAVAELETSGFFAPVAPADVGVGARRSPVARVRHFLATLDVPLVRADALVRRLYRAGLRHAFSPVGLAVQALVAVAGVVAVAVEFGRDSGVEIRVGAGQVPVFVALGAAAVVVHELAHAVVVTHYGRRIDVVGFRLHLGAPAFYVESVDALCLTRRQRLVQAAAGPWAEWVFTSLFAVALLAAPVDGTARSVLHRFVAINVFNVVSNLLPFVGLDGALLLADGVRVPDLPDRSRGAVGRLVERVAARRRPTAGEVGLAGYATANVVAATVLLAISAVLWVGLFGDLIATLWDHGPLGVAALALASLVVARPVVALLAPRVAEVAATVGRLRRRRAFRRSVPWRIAATEQLCATVPAVGALDNGTLGVLAGRLQRIPTGGTPPEGWTVVHVPAGPGIRRPVTTALDPADLDELG